MEDHYTNEHEGHHKRRPGAVMRVVDGFYDFILNSFRSIARDKELFIGTAFTVVGLLSFESDKFCDGNTADYLSCTRPSTFYFYSPLDITIIVFGVFFILIWYTSRRNNA